MLEEGEGHFHLQVIRDCDVSRLPVAWLVAVNVELLHVGKKHRLLNPGTGREK